MILISEKIIVLLDKGVSRTVQHTRAWINQIWKLIVPKSGGTSLFRCKIIGFLLELTQLIHYQLIDCALIFFTILMKML